MANLVAASGRATAIEFEPELAARAKANLAPYPNVSVVQGDGSSVAFDAADVMYVNAGATRSADVWQDRLNNGGRLILPLTTDLFTSSNWSNMHLRGAVFLVTRKGGEFHAQWISPVAIFPFEGIRDEESERLFAADGEHKRVSRLYRTDELPTEQCWVLGPGWCLAFA